MKNLALYHAEQIRRLTGEVLDVDRSHFSKSNPMTIVLSNHIDHQKTNVPNSSSSNHLEPTKPNEETSNPELDQFFQTSDSNSIPAESHALLDDMFSS